MRNEGPIVSFTFDDFPRSAVRNAGVMLREHGVAGTYYASFGIKGQTAPSGEIFRDEDLALLLEQGHELGCHTFDHCHGYDTVPEEFERSILRNRQAVSALGCGIEMRSLAYPISGPHPAIKRICGKHFPGCRAGGQSFNHGTADLNALRSFFLEQSRDDLGAVQAIIDANARSAGWLIFATHDVCPEATPFGCRPEFFGEVLRHAAGSGAALVPVSEGLRRIGADR